MNTNDQIWIRNISKGEFNHMAYILRQHGKGYEYHIGNYTAMKVKLEDIQAHLPKYYDRAVAKANPTVAVVPESTGCQCTTVRLVAAMGIIAGTLEPGQQLTAIQFEDGSGYNFNYQVNGGSWLFIHLTNLLP